MEELALSKLNLITNLQEYVYNRLQFSYGWYFTFVQGFVYLCLIYLQEIHQLASNMSGYGSIYRDYYGGYNRRRRPVYRPFGAGMSVKNSAVEETKKKVGKAGEETTNKDGGACEETNNKVGKAGEETKKAGDAGD
ncbi:hypothetical protein LWI29_035895 [Acer saccharum]|uniref:Transmembrane protein n=1 Tax=Acer saccharum TaxID=4024 RepID=A0AA39SZD7_ACESA|nr:hypothetical protein LWI29_035895 [Acer saccharum]